MILKIFYKYIKIYLRKVLAVFYRSHKLDFPLYFRRNLSLSFPIWRSILAEKFSVLPFSLQFELYIPAHFDILFVNWIAPLHGSVRSYLVIIFFLFLSFFTFSLLFIYFIFSLSFLDILFFLFLLFIFINYIVL